MEPARVDLRDYFWQQYAQLQPGFFTPMVLALGCEWNASHTTRPTLNQRLELTYAAYRSVREDWRLIRRALLAWLASGGNIKAHKASETDSPTVGVHTWAY